MIELPHSIKLLCHNNYYVLSCIVDKQALYTQLCEAINQIEVGEVLTSVQNEYSEEFYKYYLHDLIRTVHKSQNIKPEQVETEYNVRVLLHSAQN